MTLEGLQRFCAGPFARPSLNKPFSRGQWTYASDGRIIVRVPRLPDQPDSESGPRAEKIFEESFNIGFISIEPDRVPKAVMERCGNCDGKGKYEISSGEVECDECDGLGQYEKIERIQFGNQLIGCYYLRLVASIPGVMVANNNEESGPLGFIFDYGEGRLMPVRSDGCVPDYVYPVTLKKERKNV